MIEIRYLDYPAPDPLGHDLDEVVAQHASVHLERMNTGAYTLLIEDEERRICLWLRAGTHGRAVLRVSEVWTESSAARPAGQTAGGGE